MHILFIQELIILNKITFSQLCEKEVINLCDCTKIGNVCDLTFDATCGNIVSFTVCQSDKLFCFDKNSKSIVIPFECIKKIGDDIILVDITIIQGPQESPKNKIFKS